MISFVHFLPCENPQQNLQQDHLVVTKFSNTNIKKTTFANIYTYLHIYADCTHSCTHADSSLHNLMRSSEWFLVAGSSLRDKTLTHKLPLWQRRKITSGKSVMRQEAFLPAPRLAIRTGGATMMDATLTICPNNTNTTGTKPRCSLLPRCAKNCSVDSNSGCKNYPKSRRFTILPPKNS